MIALKNKPDRSNEVLNNILRFKSEDLQEFFRLHRYCKAWEALHIEYCKLYMSSVLAMWESPSAQAEVVWCNTNGAIEAHKIRAIRKAGRATLRLSQHYNKCIAELDKEKTDEQPEEAQVLPQRRGGGHREPHRVAQAHD